MTSSQASPAESGRLSVGCFSGLLLYTKDSIDKTEDDIMLRLYLEYSTCM